MIDYNSFHRYLCELVDMYHSTQSLKGMSAIARKWHCAALTKEQFFKMNLDKMTSADVTPQYSRMVRDVIGKHDVKVFLHIAEYTVETGTAAARGAAGVRRGREPERACGP